VIVRSKRGKKRAWVEGGSYSPSMEMMTPNLEMIERFGDN
jgi:hypothetical protein